MASREPKPGRRIVDYDGNQASLAGLPESDRDAISRARVSYAAGKQRLLAGDADSAIRYFRQALGDYSRYAAAHRGLGAAYEKRGDKANAAQSYRAYLTMATGAKDATQIRKRIATL